MFKFSTKAKEALLHDEYGSQKLSLLSISCIALLSVSCVATTMADELGIMKHVWIAGIFAFATFHLYRKYILPTLLTKSTVTDTDFRANSSMILLTYIVGCTSGAGFLTAFINLIGIGALVSLIHPRLPKLYYPSLLALGSIAFVALAILKLLHLYLAIPLALISAGISVYQYRISLKSEESHTDDADVERVSILTGLPKFADSSTSMKIEILRSAVALLITVLSALVLVYWVMLSINPFWMRADRISKFETLHRLPHDVNLGVREVSSLNDLEFYKTKLEKQFPVVIKPSICTTNSRNVQKCSDYKCLEKYLRERITNGPLNDQKNGNMGAWVIQEYAPKTEGVVFYYKFPYMSKGFIKNIGIREEAEKTPGKKSTALKAQYWPKTFRTDFSSKYLEFFNDLASKIPGYTGGRLDIMLPDSYESDLIDPRGTTVLELNVFFLGCIQEKSPKSFWDELKTIRTSLMQIYIGIVNIVGGYNILSFWGIAMKVPDLVSRAILCGNHEHLMAKP